ncbi:phage tail tape-measure protein [Rhodococcus sp. LBL1]|nr:phage tail tape-measure protein [Rhodococcus sp. LBL1]MDH6685848.1 phage tail tape-measure protein [Rhodococcus sp. LBL2]
MTDSMRIDVDQVRSAAPLFDAAVDDLVDRQRQLSMVLDAEGASWGSDSTGATFAAQYVPGVDRALAALRNLTDVLAGVAGGLRSTATAFEMTDSGFSRTLGGGR